MGTEHLFGIGTSKPQEIQPLRFSPQLTVEEFELTAVGQQLLAGNQNLAYILASNQFDIHVMANDTGQNQNTVYTYVGCKAQNFSGSIPANAPVRDSFTFLALDVLDVNGNSIMDTGTNAISVVTSVASAAAGLAANNLGIVA